MEVHHHPKVEKRSFKEYLLEGLMIFIAVTLGFFAESIRENLSNNEHAKLTKQLVIDLKADTLNLRRSITFERGQQRTIDTLFFLLQKPIDSADTKAIQQLVVNSYALIEFHASTGAITAIEKELNIKQFADSKLPALIADHESKINTINNIYNVLLKLLEDNLEPFTYQHFTAVNAYNVFSKDSVVTVGKMRNLTQEDMTELSIKIELINTLVSNLIERGEEMKKQASELMQYAIEQYDLEN